MSEIFFFHLFYFSDRCGVFYKVHKKHRPHNLSKQSKNILGSSSTPRMMTSTTTTDLNKSLSGDYHGSKTTNLTTIKCSNCMAMATPMWRKAPDGTLMCNACAL